MSNKKQALYKEVFQNIKDLCPSFSPETLLMDFEAGLMCATRESFGNAAIQGCWFHYVQSIYRRLSTSGLTKLFLANKEFKSFTKKLFCLPLLPANLIVRAFEKLMSEIETKPFYEDAEILANYFRTYWISKVGVETLSVFGNPARTNNGQESINSKLKTKIGLHPNFWSFLKKLKDFTLSIENDIQRLSRGQKISREKKKETLQRSSEIEFASNRLIATDINEHQFIRMVSHTVQDFIEEDHILEESEEFTRSYRSSSIPISEQEDSEINVESSATPDTPEVTDVAEDQSAEHPITSKTVMDEIYRLVKHDQIINRFLSCQLEFDRKKDFTNSFGIFSECSFQLKISNHVFDTADFVSFNDMDKADKDVIPNCIIMAIKKIRKCTYEEALKLFIEGEERDEPQRRAWTMEMIRDAVKYVDSQSEEQREESRRRMERRANFFK